MHEWMDGWMEMRLIPEVHSLTPHPPTRLCPRLLPGRGQAAHTGGIGADVTNGVEALQLAKLPADSTSASLRLACAPGPWASSLVPLMSHFSPHDGPAIPALILQTRCHPSSPATNRRPERYRNPPLPPQPGCPRRLNIFFLIE